VFHERDGYDRTGGGLRSLPSFIISKLIKKEKEKASVLENQRKRKEKGKKNLDLVKTVWTCCRPPTLLVSCV
jgi:hypothetical protein